ncbi:MAG: hypothetical protein ACERIH_10460 [Labilibaculum antarcticum]
MLSSAQHGFDTSKPLSIPMGPLSPINDLAGVLIQQYSDDLEETLEKVLQDELAEAKKQGLSAVQGFVDGWRHSKDYKYRLEAISSDTTNKLLQGEFKNITQLEEFENSLSGESSGQFKILYREVENKNRKEVIIIVESIFINE